MKNGIHLTDRSDRWCWLWETKRAFSAPPNRAEQKGAMETNEFRY
jgi:hypothetical protein